MYLALYRRYRPQRFNDVVGQHSAISVIKKAVGSNSLGHAYLFSGPRGCGKTSVARLIAKVANCTSIQPDSEPCGHCESCMTITNGENLDIVEIDGASNNGVDEVRELKSHVALSPFSSRFKVYIIDEVHMLSLAAFNALLKTLEEPPDNVIFILATTEPYKVPVTIRSRCQHIPFHRISEKGILEKLSTIAVEEGLSVEEEALWEISRQADGALRDALSLMEQAMTLDHSSITLQNVTALLGGASYSELEKLFRTFRMDLSTAYRSISEILSRGASPGKIIEGLFILAKNLWIVNNWGNEYIKFLNLSEGEKEFLGSEAQFWSSSRLTSIMDFCVDMIPRVRAGMRTDVLSGLIFREFMDSDSGDPRPALECVQEQQPDTDSSRIEEDHEVTISFEDNQTEDRPEVRVACAISPDPADRGYYSSTETDIAEAAIITGDESGSSHESLTLSGREHSVLCWSKELTVIKNTNIAIYAALLHTVIRLEDTSLEIDFPLEANTAFQILSLDRNLYILQDALVESGIKGIKIINLRYKDEGKKFVFNESSSDEGIYDTPEAGKIEQSSLFSQDDKPQASRKPVVIETVSECGHDPSSPGGAFKDVVQEILNCTNGELVMLKSENQQSYEDEDE